MLSPLCFCLISRLPLFDLHKKWLTEVYKDYVFKLYGSAEERKESDYTLEFYVSLLFHYLGYNASQMDEVAVVSREERKEIMRYRNYSEIGITMPNFTFQVLLETIEPSYIVYLIRLILLERRLIFIKNDCADNTIIIESLLQLICPLYFGC